MKTLTFIISNSMRETFIANRGVLKQTIGTHLDPTGGVINEYTDVNVLEFPDNTTVMF